MPAGDDPGATGQCLSLLLASAAQSLNHLGGHLSHNEILPTPVCRGHRSLLGWNPPRTCIRLDSIREERRGGAGDCGGD